MKIKNNKTVIGMVCAVLVFISSAFGALAQKTLPIDSVGAAVSYDLLQVRQVYGELYAASLVNTNGSKTFWSVNYNPNNVPKIDDLIAIVVTNQFAFMVARPTNDPVNVYVSYNNTDGDQLFYEDMGFMLVQSNGSWQVPASASTNLQTYLGYYEPIYQNGAVGARLNLRDAYGNFLQTVFLDVQYNSSTGTGKIMNQTQYLGQHGEMVVTYGQFDQYGDETNSYDVAYINDEGKGGVALPVAGEKAVFTPSWNELVMQMAPPNVILTNVPSVNHVGTSPLVEFTLTNATTVFFSAESSEGEIANGFTIKLLKSGFDLPSVPYSIPANETGVSVSLPEGTYHIDFTWPQLAPAQVYPSWYYGGTTVTVPVVSGSDGGKD